MPTTPRCPARLAGREEEEGLIHLLTGPTLNTARQTVGAQMVFAKSMSSEKGTQIYTTSQKNIKCLSWASNTAEASYMWRSLTSNNRYQKEPS